MEKVLYSFFNFIYKTNTYTYNILAKKIHPKSYTPKFVDVVRIRGRFLGTALLWILNPMA